MAPKLSATKFLRDEQLDALVTECTSKTEFSSCVRQLAAAGYMLPLTVLQFCFEDE